MGGAGPDLSTCCLAPCYLSTRSLTQLLLFKIFHSYLKLCSVRKIQAMLQYLDSVPLLEHFLFSLHILGPLQSRVFLFPYIEQKGDVFHLFARAARIWDFLLFFFFCYSVGGQLDISRTFCGNWSLFRTPQVPSCRGWDWGRAGDW